MDSSFQHLGIDFSSEADKCDPPSWNTPSGSWRWEPPPSPEVLYLISTQHCRRRLTKTALKKSRAFRNSGEASSPELVAWVFYCLSDLATNDGQLVPLVLKLLLVFYRGRPVCAYHLPPKSNRLTKPNRTLQPDGFLPITSMLISLYPCWVWSRGLNTQPCWEPVCSLMDVVRWVLTQTICVWLIWKSLIQRKVEFGSPMSDSLVKGLWGGWNQMTHSLFHHHPAVIFEGRWFLSKVY